MRHLLYAGCKTLAALLAVVVLALLTVGAAPARSMLAPNLVSHANALAGGSLDQNVHYIETALARLGYEVLRREAAHQGGHAQQIEVTLGAAPVRVFILGATGPPGSRTMARSAAAVIELARLLRQLRPASGTGVRFAFLVGSNSTGNFIAFAGERGEAALVRKALASFRPASPPEGLATPAYVEGVTASGAMLITDTALLRYPYVKAAHDKDAVPDADDLAQAVAGTARLVASLAAPASM